MRQLALLLAFAAAALPALAGPAKDDPLTSRRTAWWREGRFGMFIHWGIYAIPARGEWVMHNEKIQVPEYEKLAPRFNPVDFNAREWVAIAKAAGMKYIIITSKHHDGFCMFDTQLTDYKVTRTPFRRDPLKELAQACRAAGIRLCFYHSIMDWHHPDYLPRRPWEAETRPAAGADLKRYLAHMKGQLRELLTRYGPVGVIWFDGGWEHPAQEQDAQGLLDLIHQLQPNCLVNDRTNLPADFATPEQQIPAAAMKGRLWETCMTLNDNWGYHANDNHWKTPTDLVRKLADIASKGGNFLLNVGPTERGVISAPSVERLRAVGAWMAANGESIYGTTASPYARPYPWGRVTRKGNRLYLHVFEWPAGDHSLVVGLKGRVKRARMLAGRAPVGCEPAGADAVRLLLPAKAPDPADSVVVVECSGRLQVVDPPLPAATPAEDGSVTLPARSAQIHGDTARYEEGGGRDNIGYWINRDDWVSWDVELPREGRYSVEMVYASQQGTEGSAFTITAGAEQLTGEVGATGGWVTFRPHTLGALRLPAGRTTVAVRATAMPRGAVMNLQAIRLVPEAR